MGLTLQTLKREVTSSGPGCGEEAQPALAHLGSLQTKLRTRPQGTHARATPKCWVESCPRGQPALDLGLEQEGGTGRPRHHCAPSPPPRHQRGVFLQESSHRPPQGLEGSCAQTPHQTQEGVGSARTSSGQGESWPSCRAGSRTKLTGQLLWRRGHQAALLSARLGGAAMPFLPPTHRQPVLSSHPLPDMQRPRKDPSCRENQAGQTPRKGEETGASRGPCTLQQRLCPARGQKATLSGRSGQRTVVGVQGLPRLKHEASAQEHALL